MKKKVTISLIVLNYNGRKHLQEYFTSVYEQTLLPDEIIMMDNMSTDGSQEYVEKNFPEVKIVSENRFNLGTAKASNVGFEHSTGDLVIFQSNDLRLDKHCVKALVDELESDKKIGIVTSVFVSYKPNAKGEYIVDNAGGHVDKYGFGMQAHANEVFSQMPTKGEVFLSYGSSFIISRKLFNAVNGFDERMFNLNEDFDLSWRVRLKGYKIMFTKKSFAYHKGSATLKLRERPIKRYWAERNSIRMFIKNAKRKQIFHVFFMYLLMVFAQMSFFLYKRRFALFFSDLKAVLWNLWYLPETLFLRYKIQSSQKKNNIDELIQNTSFKIKFFIDLYRINAIDKVI